MGLINKSELRRYLKKNNMHPTEKGLEEFNSFLLGLVNAIIKFCKEKGYSSFMKHQIKFLKNRFLSKKLNKFFKEEGD